MRNSLSNRHKRHTIGALAFTLWMLLGLNTLSQNNWHNTSLFNTTNGLSNNNITALFRDSRGLLWIGTEDGLSQYDGYRFITYRHCNDDSTSIAGNMIRAIEETPDGNLWIATVEHGLCVWQRNTNKFICLNSHNNPKGSLPEIEIQGILVVGEYVYVKTRNYISSVHNKSYKIESFPIIEHLVKKFDHGKASLTLANQSKLLLVGGAEGCQLFDIEKRQFIKTPPSLNYFGSVNDLVRYEDHLVMSTNKGLVLFNDTLQIVSFKRSKQTNQEFYGLSTGEDGKLWIAGINSVERIDSIAGEPHSIITDLQSIKGMGAYRINCLLIDHNQNIWLGTRHNGLLRIDLKKPKFNALLFDEATTLSSDVMNMTFTRDGSLIFAAGSRGLAMVKNTSPTLRNKISYTPINGKEATCVMERKDQTIWIGTNAGIYILNEKRNQLNEFNYAGEKEFTNLLGQNHINNIIEDRLGNMWFATSFGLYKYNGESITSYFCDRYTDDGLCNDWINVVFEDEQGWIWVGTNEGLRYLIPGETEFISIRNTPKNKGLLSNNHVLSFCQVSNHEILIGTRSGINCFSKNNMGFTVYANNSLFNNDVINSILLDDHKQIWIGSNNGLSMITPSSNVFNFHQRDGLKNAYFSRGSIAMHMGVLYFGGAYGIDFVEPGVVPYNKTAPRMIINSINIEYSNGEKVFFQAEDNKQLTIRYKRNAMVSIDFSALDFTFPQRCQYKVFMDGYDKNWSAPTHKNTVNYFDLPPGNYVLNIMASNSDQLWQDTPLQLSIRVIPPLWKTNYAYAFYFLMLVIMLHIVSNYRVFKIKRAYRELEEKSQAKRMLEDQRDKLARVHQSLKDSIGYAKRIQEAMIPSEERVRNMFPDSFVYFRPKDIVSGDFYWIFENEEKQIVVAADCTGHGVPGAFMSIIGLDLLKNAIEQQMVYDPATILSILNKGIHATFAVKNNLETDGFNMNDGMDIAICVIDKTSRLLTFAGGMSSIYLIRDNEIISYKGDRKPIGSLASSGTSSFEKQEIQLQNNDFIYLFSDGYADQFGGPEGKKFKYRRFRHLLLNIHKLPAEDQKNIIHQKFEEWIGTKYEQIDDVLVLGFAHQDEDAKS